MGVVIAATLIAGLGLLPAVLVIEGVRWLVRR